MKNIHVPQCSLQQLFTITRTQKQLIYPSTDEWVGKLCICLEYYSAIKRNTFESVLMRWMNLELDIQSEVSQKEKDKYHISTHIYGIWKDSIDDPTCRAANETQTFWTQWGKGEGGMI